MKTHRIDLQAAPYGKRGSRARMLYGSEDLGVSHQPLFAAARKLLELGYAQLDDTIETWRDGSISMRGLVGTAAGLTVHEPDKGGLAIRRYTPREYNHVKQP